MTEEITPPDDGQELPDDQPCDFNRTDAEEARLLAWAAEQSKLTEQAIDEQIAAARKKLDGIGAANIKYFGRAVRWKLLKMMVDRGLSADSLDDMFEPTDQELEQMEGKKKKKKDKKPKKDIPPKPDHIEQIGNKRVAVFKPKEPERVAEPDEDEEDSHPLYKQIPKGLCRKVKQWMEEQSQQLSGLNPRTIGGLAVAELDKDACRFAAENETAFLAYIHRRMEKQQLEEPQQDVVALPQELESKIAGVELTEQERMALALFAAVQGVSSADMKQKVKPEAVCVASGDQEFDTFECPLCIRSLETKLAGLGMKFDIKCSFGTKHRFNGAQGSRVNWIRVSW